MVRLKDIAAYSCARCFNYFNSTMVRLKGINEAIAQSEMKFQFHYGTIKSTISQSCSGSALLYFNSTMVRLKDSHAEFDYITIRNFNSTMVRLKDLHRPVFLSNQIYFNSTMVRLKETYSTELCPVHNYFNSTMVRLKVSCLAVA